MDGAPTATTTVNSQCDCQFSISAVISDCDFSMLLSILGLVLNSGFRCSPPLSILVVGAGALVARRGGERGGKGWRIGGVTGW